MIKNLFKLFTKRKEENMQHRAEKSRELKRAKKLQQEAEEASDKLDILIAELQKRNAHDSK